MHCKKSRPEKVLRITAELGVVEKWKTAECDKGEKREKREK